MRRPPLISFVTFNRLGNTATSLHSLLRTDEEFELFLLDNGSKDKTFEFLLDTKDPRIKYRHKLEDNIGVVHALNKILTYRAQDQDWINYEYDFHIHDKKFITSFREIYEEFPDMGAISASVYPRMILNHFPEEIKKDPSRMIERNGKRIYKDYLMGFCAFVPYEAMNQLMYYDEVDAFADLEFNLRIRSIDRWTGYAMDIQCSHITDGGNCDTCLALHRYCKGYISCKEILGSKECEACVVQNCSCAPHNMNRKPSCTKYYSRIVSKVMEDIHMWEVYALLRKNADELGVFPDSEKRSIFEGNKLSLEDEKASKKVMELFKKYSREHVEEVDKKYEAIND
jgi:glycosyltransferase involved in cell wall biosynthesis